MVDLGQCTKTITAVAKEKNKQTQITFVAGNQSIIQSIKSNEKNVSKHFAQSENEKTSEKKVRQQPGKKKKQISTTESCYLPMSSWGEKFGRSRVHNGTSFKLH